MEKTYEEWIDFFFHHHPHYHIKKSRKDGLFSLQKGRGPRALMIARDCTLDEFAEAWRETEEWEAKQFY